MTGDSGRRATGGHGNCLRALSRVPSVRLELTLDGF